MTSHSHILSSARTEKSALVPKETKMVKKTYPTYLPIMHYADHYCFKVYAISDI